MFGWVLVRFFISRGSVQKQHAGTSEEGLECGYSVHGIFAWLISRKTSWCSLVLSLSIYLFFYLFLSRSCCPVVSFGELLHGQRRRSRSSIRMAMEPSPPRSLAPWCDLLGRTPQRQSCRIWSMRFRSANERQCPFPTQVDICFRSWASYYADHIDNIVNCLEGELHAAWEEEPSFYDCLWGIVANDMLTLWIGYK